MRLEWELAVRGYRRFAAYPAATWAGIFTNTVFGFIQAYVLLSVYETRGDIGGYDAAQTLTYVWLAQAMLSTVGIFGDAELAQRIQRGDVATDLDPAGASARAPGSPPTTAALCTTRSSAGCRRSWSARSSST